uniref:tRNA pseudouridine synthase B n=1 Tax=uncultured Thiotrichaceae bacterium TaxID=298394 RepID=A0A6S6UN37_9GAMM|nr:MAG: tRNA pseudouridine synthase B (EC [uncultured Thiotrichaceae bacterium]
MARRNFRKLDGILLLDKSLGASSNRVLQDARFLYQAAKAGHTGSLDPLASGMLPVCFGEATKVSAFLLDADKCYVTTAQLGAMSDTGDAEGTLFDQKDVPAFTEAEIEAVLECFRGPIQQIPPMYSALKKDGQPLYKLARQGVEIERESRPVIIHELILKGFTADTLSLEVRCSKGTYIRTLVEDIGKALKCGAYVSMLRRTEVSPFNDLPMYTFDSLKASFEQGGMSALDEYLLPMDQALPHLPALTLNDDDLGRLRQGQKLSLKVFPDGAPEQREIIRIYDASGVFSGLGEVTELALKPKRMLAC